MQGSWRRRVVRELQNVVRRAIRNEKIVRLIHRQTVRAYQVHGDRLLWNGLSFCEHDDGTQILVARENGSGGIDGDSRRRVEAYFERTRRRGSPARIFRNVTSPAGVDLRVGDVDGALCVDRD